MALSDRPLSREDALAFLRRGPAFASLRGCFLCFVMIPVEPRIGEWRFAGVADSAAKVYEVLMAFQHALAGDADAASGPDWLEAVGEMDMDLQGAWSFDDLPLDEVGPHQVLLFAEGGAPYDDCGLAILEVPTLEGSPFATRAPESQRPAAWDGGAPEEDEGDEDE